MNKKLMLPIVLGFFLLLSTFSVVAYGYNYGGYGSHSSYNSESSYSYTKTYEKTYDSLYYHDRDYYPSYSYHRHGYGNPTYQVYWGPSPSAIHNNYYDGYYGRYQGPNSYRAYGYSTTSYNSYGSNSYRLTSYSYY